MNNPHLEKHKDMVKELQSSHTNLAQCLGINARNRPRHPALVYGERIILHCELDELVRCTASWLQSQGIQHGDIVGVALDDTPEHLIAIYALAAMGAIVLPMDCRWTPDEQSKIAYRFSAKHVLLEADASWPGGGSAIYCNEKWRSGVVQASPLMNLAEGMNLPFLLSLSSGTTGQPKGPLITHDQFMRRFGPIG